MSAFGLWLSELRAKLQGQIIARKHRDDEGEIHIVETKMAPRTVNLILALLRSILRFAVANGHIAASPTDRLGHGKLMLPLERGKLAPPIEKAEDVGRLLAAVREIGDETNRPNLNPIFALLAYTGLRRGEALGLRWADVDLDRRMITVRHSYDGMTKSSKHRTVPVPVPAALGVILRRTRSETLGKVLSASPTTMARCTAATPSSKPRYGALSPV